MSRMCLISAGIVALARGRRKTSYNLKFAFGDRDEADDDEFTDTSVPRETKLFELLPTVMKRRERAHARGETFSEEDINGVVTIHLPVILKEWDPLL